MIAIRLEEIDHGYFLGIERFNNQEDFEKWKDENDFALTMNSNATYYDGATCLAIVITESEDGEDERTSWRRYYSILTCNLDGPKMAYFLSWGFGQSFGEVKTQTWDELADLFTA